MESKDSIRRIQRIPFVLGGNKSIKRRLTKEELMRKLQEKGVTATGNMKNLQRLCRNAGINLVEMTPKIQQGWEDQPKGMLQILWERGWINEQNLASYTVSGKKNVLGILEANTSLKHLLGTCRDFEEEESLLQSQGRSLGIIVDRTPMCHCELAGEGIEYSWGCSKNYYRGRPISEKRKKENFRSTVRQCLSNNILTTERVRKFSRRARQYILAYHMLHAQQQQRQERQQEQQQEQHREQQQQQQQDPYLITPAKIESLVKDFKTHRCALDFDRGFIKATLICPK